MGSPARYGPRRVRGGPGTGTTCGRLAQGLAEVVVLRLQPVQPRALPRALQLRRRPLRQRQVVRGPSPAPPLRTRPSPTSRPRRTTVQNTFVERFHPTLYHHQAGRGLSSASVPWPRPLPTVGAPLADAQRAPELVRITRGAVPGSATSPGFVRCLTARYDPGSCRRSTICMPTLPSTVRLGRARTLRSGPSSDLTIVRIRLHHSCRTMR
jgi:hypothetical protein